MAAGIYVTIYRDAGGSDCTLGGVTSVKRGATRAILMGVPRGNVRESDIREDDVVLEVCAREINGEQHYYAVPREIGSALRSMFGGNFVYTSDSRFADRVGSRPLPVHDRVER